MNYDVFCCSTSGAVEFILGVDGEPYNQQSRIHSATPGNNGN
jgi:hypothetical protein